MKQIINISLIMLLVVSGCKKEEDVVNVNTNTNNFTPTIMTCVKGIILGIDGEPISGVNVNIEGVSQTTSEKGLFFFNDINISTDRAIIFFEKDGYFRTSRALEANEGVTNYLRLVLDQKQVDATVNSSSGASLTLSNGISLNLRSGSYYYNDGSAYYGDINVSVNKISPGGANFSMRIPGGDLRAITMTGDDMRLYSYGMLDVVLTDNNGEKINTGSNTQISFPIPNNMLADAPSQIPLWYYDELTGIWIEEGSAVRSGNEYIGDVSHFSYWNWDL